MDNYTPDFSVDVQAVKGLCPVGETYAKQQIAAGTIPVLTCEGPCIRGEIARQAGNLIAKQVPSLARACHGEAFYVPHSAMASWVRTCSVSSTSVGGAASASASGSKVGWLPASDSAYRTNSKRGSAAAFTTSARSLR